jgi:hypothetical protein
LITPVRASATFSLSTRRKSKRPVRLMRLRGFPTSSF